MYLVYKPAGQPEQRWLYQPGRMKAAEMIAIEKRTGLPYSGAFKQNLMEGGTLARQALLWTMLRREHHTLRFEDVDFYDDELQLVMDRVEVRAELDALEEADGITDLERIGARAILTQQLKDAPEPPGKSPAHATGPDPEPPVQQGPPGWTRDSAGNWLSPSLPDPDVPAAVTTSPVSPEA